MTRFQIGAVALLALLVIVLIVPWARAATCHTTCIGGGMQSCTTSCRD